jgi:hypothetical protein
VEAVALSIIVGLSVDYTLHLGHAYNRCPHPDRSRRTRAAVMDMAGSLLASCVTSVGSMLVLTLCVIRIFVVMGTIVAVTVTAAVAITLGPLAATLLLVGPQGDFGRLQLPCRRTSRQKRDRKAELAAAMASHHLLHRLGPVSVPGVSYQAAVVATTSNGKDLDVDGHPDLRSDVRFDFRSDHRFDLRSNVTPPPLARGSSFSAWG